MGDTEQSQIEDLVESLSEKSHATRRNLDSLGTLGLVDFGDNDLAISDILLLFASVLVFLFVSNLSPDGRLWGLLSLGIGTILFGTILLGALTSPPGMSFYKLLKCKMGFKFGESYRSAHNGDSGRITTDSVSTDGERRGLEDLTRVDGFAPQAAGVWRFDGALVGGCSIDPAELTLASDADWEAASDELGQFINSLSHAGQMRNGSVKIDTEAVKQRFGTRMGDPDVRSNPKLQQNVVRYKEKLPEQMNSKNASIRGFQFLAPVTMEEVQMQGHRVLDQLKDIPVLGSGAASLLASRDLTVAEIRYRQEQVMNDRRKSIAQNLAGITGCDADELSMDELISVLEESWTGERVVTEERDDRSLPLVTMSREYTETDGDTQSPDQLGEDELDRQIIEDLQKSAAVVEDAIDDEDDTVEEETVDDLDDEPESEPEPDPETPSPPEPETPSVPDQTDSEPEPVEDPEPDLGEGEYATLEEACSALVEKMEAAEGESEPEAEADQEPVIDEEEYDTLEEACSALVEEMEVGDDAESEHSEAGGDEGSADSSDSGADSQEATT